MLRHSRMVLCIVLCLGLFGWMLAGCGQETAEPEEKPADEQEPVEPEPEEPEEEKVQVSPGILNIATHPTGSLHNLLGTAYADVLDRNMDERFNVIATSGPIESFPLLETGDMHLIAINNWDSMMGRAGGAAFGDLNPDGFPIRLVFESIYFRMSALVPKDSDLWTAEDFIGKRVAGTFEASPAVTMQAMAVWANLGVLDEVNIETFATVGEHQVALREGRIDASFGAIGEPLIEEADATIGVRFINLDESPEAVERMREYYPLVPQVVQPGPVGIDEPTVMGAYRSYLVCAEQLSDDLVYNMTKTIFEYFDELRPAHALLDQLTLEELVTDTFTIPFHDGAVRYFKEAGIWTEEMEALQQELLQ